MDEGKQVNLNIYINKNTFIYLIIFPQIKIRPSLINISFPSFSDLSILIDTLPKESSGKIRKYLKKINIHNIDIKYLNAFKLVKKEAEEKNIIIGDNDLWNIAISILEEFLLYLTPNDFNNFKFIDLRKTKVYPNRYIGLEPSSN